jgi:hypothetical protein
MKEKYWSTKLILAEDHPEFTDYNLNRSEKSKTNDLVEGMTNRTSNELT